MEFLKTSIVASSSVVDTESAIVLEDTSISDSEYWFIYGVLFVVLMVSVMASSQVASSIVQEKSSRVVEQYTILGGSFNYEWNTGSNENNTAVLEGFLCKKPIYRKTPLGREIADIMLAVNRSYGKSDYIPCICWGRNARYVEGLEIGAHIKAIGRIQSREYSKKYGETETKKTAYELSVGKLEIA